MRIHYVSDVHLEFGKWKRNWRMPDVDVHVLAGDIGVGLQGIDWALQAFKKPVVMVFGNHEYYGQRMMSELWVKARAKVAGTHVHLLENDSVVIDGVRFLGCSLWTDFLLFGPENQQAMMQYAARAMTDFRVIRTGRTPRHAGCGDDSALRSSHHQMLTPAKSLALHQASRAYLERELEGRAYPTVVVTHHSPSARSLRYRQPVEKTDACYSSHLEPLVGQADLWIHGHVHEVLDYTPEAGGRIVANCRGYEGSEQVIGFRHDRVVELAV